MKSGSNINNQYQYQQQCEKRNGNGGIMKRQQAYVWRQP